MNRQVLLMALVLATSGGVTARSFDDDVPMRRVKPNGEEMRRLLLAGYRTAPTFRRLVDDLHDTDAVVVVEFGFCARGRFRSCVAHVEAGATSRHVRIRISGRGTDAAMIAMIGHELHHAREILQEPTVVDARSVLALYRRIGTRPCRERETTACESEGALETERVIRRELHDLRHTVALADGRAR